MELQLWIAVSLMVVVFFTKLLLILFSDWYAHTQLRLGSLLAELMIFALAIVLNVLGIYGLRCSLKGGCHVYAWMICAVLGAVFVAQLFTEVIAYKCRVTGQGRHPICTGGMNMWSLRTTQ